MYSMRVHALLFLSLLGLAILLPTQSIAQEPLGFGYACLQTELCKTPGATESNPKCSTGYGHRVLLTTHPNFKPGANKDKAYVTECFDLVIPAETGTLQTVCTTGSSELDKELFCPGKQRDDATCDKLGLLQNKYRIDSQYVIQSTFKYTIKKSEIQDQVARERTDVPDYGIFYLEGTSMVKHDPKVVQTDNRSTMIPAKIEWQSYTEGGFTRKFLIWNAVDAVLNQDKIDDTGQKQSTLTFGGSCTGINWDPEGIVYDVQTGNPITDVQLSIDYATTANGNFSPALAGIGQVLPPGTSNPLFSGTGGYYQFFGAEGYYTIAPSHPQFTHYTEGSAAIPYQVTSLYSISKNYYANSSAIFEKAGTRQVRHIPLIINAGQSAPPYVFAVQEASVTAQPSGVIQITGRTNGPATAIVAICKESSGVSNCRNEKQYTPSNGGPSPDSYFRFTLTAKQSELTPGEKFVLSFQPFSLVPPQARSSMIDRIISFVQSLIPVVSAQEESRVVRLTVEPIPTYLEGYAYDGLGNVIPNAEVGIYVSFSPRAIYQTKADAQGYYQITSEYLPRDPYTIKYSDPAKEGVEIVLQTSQVLAQNNEFMIVEKIDPYKVVTESTNPRAQVTPTFIPRDAAQNPGTAQNPVVSPPVNQGQPENTKPETPQQSSTMILVVAILLIVLSLGGGVAVFMMMKKRREEEENR